ncbi:MAG: hypothetical protein LAO51_15855 [Acidobacteriia bacterium]|nr:hypothetical protein [Terriglobia bacterium]
MSKVRRWIGAGVVTLALAAVLAGSTTLFAAPAQIKPCSKCPVDCPGYICFDTGHFYCNLCLAHCDGAHHCGLAG